MKKILNRSISWGDAAVLYSLYLFLVSCIILILSGCMTTEKARQMFDRHPGDFADLSLKHFPCVPDSAGKIPIYKPAGNIDYTGMLDSLKQSGDSLRAALDQAEKYAADSINRQCADLVAGYKQQVTRLAATIDSLRHRYQPPKPDSVPAPYRVVSLAEKAIIVQLQDSLVKKEREIAQLKIQNADQRATISEKKKQIVLHWVGHAAAIALFGLAAYFKLNKFIP